MDDIKIYGYTNVSIIMPNEPLLSICGPLDKVQLIETTLLNLTNYPTLICSLTTKIRNLIGENNIVFIEDGIQFSQTSYGGILGSKYSAIGSVECKFY
jgi:nicotinate phosphoribosyltransferase